MFSTPAQSALCRAGWYPKRRISIDCWTTALTAEGYHIFPCAQSLLENLGGLVVVPLPNSDNLRFPGKITFDPMVAGSGEFDRASDFQERLGQDVFPVAEVQPRDLVLVVPDKRIYSASDHTLYLLGNDIEEAMDVLLFANRDLQPLS